MSNGANAAKGLPGYKKTLTSKYYPELYNAPPVAPPDAGLPWKVGDQENNPLIEDPPTPPPPKPDRHLIGLNTCQSCGASFGFGPTDAAKCPNCTDAQAMTSGLYTPGTPWF